MDDREIDLATERPFGLGRLEVRPPTREIRPPDAPPSIVEPRVMQVLVVLARAQGEVVSRDALLGRCWGGRAISDDAINRAIAKVRQLADLTAPPAFVVETIPRVGYRLTGDTTAESATQESLGVAVSPPPGSGAPAAAGAGSGGRWPRWTLILVALLLAVGAGFAVVRSRGHGRAEAVARAASGPPKVTALPFQVLGGGDPDLLRLTGGLQADIVAQLNSAQLAVVEPARAATAAYGIGGAVERDGQDIVVRLKLDDLRQHATVWSEELRDAAVKADVLQRDAANLAGHVVMVAARRDAEAKGDTETIGLMVRADLFSMRNSDQAREEEWNNDRLLAAKLPRSPFVHANVAIVSSFLAATSSSPERATGLRAMAAAEATKALDLDPANDFGYFARYLTYPAAGRWSEREAVLKAGLKVRPQSALLTNHYSNFLREVGRTGEALEFGRASEAVRPPTANRDATLLLAAASVEGSREAIDLAARLGGVYLDHPAVWNGRFEAFLSHRRWGDAAALLQPGADRSGMGEAERGAWLQALKAMAGGAAADRRKAVAALVALPAPGGFVVQPPHEIYNPGERIGMVALLGGTDEAFALAGAYLHRDAYADSSFLFWPGLSDFRRDPRFSGLMQQVGLAAYWRAAGRTPDVCADKARPAFCRSGP